METHTCVVGASIRRHFPHKGHSCSRAAAGTATAKHYGTQTGMRVQSMHDCLPVCASLCVLSESCGWVSPTGPSMQLLSLMHKTYEHKRKPAPPPLYTTHSLIHTVKIIDTLKKTLENISMLQIELLRWTHTHTHTPLRIIYNSYWVKLSNYLICKSKHRTF